MSLSVVLVLLINVEGFIEGCLELCGQTAQFIVLTLPLTKSLGFPVSKKMNFAAPITFDSNY